ncbi:uncharacterized protein LAJ45_04469 [Morchella importuna]|uniref:uncharacterized protein n=1 Tax=Morchella importuna TaxID=1174673 RepID=UPI001E8D3130|nr:uncharacterized protein LAJ45_04469 [Morchella importuna]KAH8151267.1 hypothetical protein LAJ45_04469 [Morchella importuna]
MSGTHHPSSATYFDGRRLVENGSRPWSLSSLIVLVNGTLSAAREHRALWSAYSFIFEIPRILLTRPDAKSFLTDAWVRGLRRARDDDDMPERRKIAERLLNRYEINGVDKHDICKVFDILQPPAPLPQATCASQPAIFVSGNVSNSTLTSNVGSRKRKRPASNGRNDSPPTRRAAPASRRAASASRHLKAFKHTWASLKDRAKWPLRDTSGANNPSLGGVRYVEDVLYHHFKDCEWELAVHSWVIDTSDEQVMGLFSDNERRMICEEIPPLPETDGWFLDAIVRYGGHNNADQFKEYIYTTPPLTPEIPLEERAGRTWLDNAMRCWSGLLDSPSAFTRDHGEFWLTSNMWGILYDQCMGTVPGTYISRGESMSLSTSDRKNVHRSPDERQRIGHLYDSIMRLDNHEVGAAEHSKTFVSEFARKWTRDTLKVVKVLHDMLYRLQKSTIPLRGRLKLQVLGAVMGGWHCQNRRMVIGKGYMCVMTVDVIRKVPSQYDRVDDLLQQLQTFWAYRNVLNACKQSIDVKPRTAAELREFLSGAATPVGIEGPMIPRSMETEPDDTSDCGEEEGC